MVKKLACTLFGIANIYLVFWLLDILRFIQPEGNECFSFWQSQNQQQPPPKIHMQPLPHQPQFHPLQQTHHQSIHQSQHATHFPNTHQCAHSSHLPEIPHHQSPTLSQHMTCLQPLSGGHVGGRMHVLVSVFFFMPFFFCFVSGVTLVIVFSIRFIEYASKHGYIFPKRKRLSYQILLLY